MLGRAFFWCRSRYLYISDYSHVYEFPMSELHKRADVNRLVRRSRCATKDSARLSDHIGVLIDLLIICTTLALRKMDLSNSSVEWHFVNCHQLTWVVWINYILVGKNSIFLNCKCSARPCLVRLRGKQDERSSTLICNKNLESAHD